MTISTQAKLVLRCSSCGEISRHELSLFSFSGSNQFVFDCPCGQPLASLGTKDKKHFWLQMECSFCDERHLYYYQRKDLWDKEVLSVICDDTGMEIAHVGPPGMVEDIMLHGERSLAEMAQDLGFGEYFSSPEVMYGILDGLYMLAENGDLFCQCGNYDVEIEIYPDRLELKCDYCGCSGMVMAQNERDLEALRNLSEIELTSKGFRCLEGKKSRTPRRRFKK